jgi:hypothetical protein
MNRLGTTLEQRYKIKNPLSGMPVDREMLVAWLMLERGEGRFGDERKIGTAVDYLIEKAGGTEFLGWCNQKIFGTNTVSGVSSSGPYLRYDVTFAARGNAIIPLGLSSWEGCGICIVRDSFRMHEVGAGLMIAELLEEVLIPALEKQVANRSTENGSGGSRNQDRGIGGVGCVAALSGGSAQMKMVSQFGR